MPLLTEVKRFTFLTTQGLVAHLLQKNGIDRAVGFTLIGRFWTALSGALTLFMLTRYLTSVQQGYYYTFNSVLALQVFFELGLSFVILQFASHECSKLHWTSNKTLEGDVTAKARLASLLRGSLVWYSVMAVLMVATLLPVGLSFFGNHQSDQGHLDQSHIAWQWPWVWVVLVSGGMLTTSPLFAVVEGCGLVAEVALVQTVQNVSSSLLLWVGLSQHWALYAAPFSTTFGLFYGMVWLWRSQRLFAYNLLVAYRPETTVSWRREIWPFQWKIALSWLSGYFVSSLFNPLLFAYHGPVSAGQMGLSFSIMGAIAAIAMAWVTTKSAPFGSLIARREFAQLDRLFFPTLWQSSSVVVFGGICFWAASLGLHLLHHPLSQRLLPPMPLLLLVLTVAINHIVFAQALYLRAHKQEPFLILSIAIGLVTGLSSFFLVRPFGATGLMWGYFTICACGLGGATWIFLRKRQQWHDSEGFAQ